MILCRCIAKTNEWSLFRWMTKTAVHFNVWLIFPKKGFSRLTFVNQLKCYSFNLLVSKYFWDKVHTFSQVIFSSILFQYGITQGIVNLFLEESSAFIVISLLVCKKAYISNYCVGQKSRVSIWPWKCGTLQEKRHTRRNGIWKNSIFIGRYRKLYFCKESEYL